MGAIVWGVTGLLSVGALAYDKFMSGTDELMEHQTPNLMALGALAVAGFAVYALASRKK